MIELIIPTADAMEGLGRRMAARLSAGDLVLLNGELGAGKTTLTRGIGAGLGVRGAVTSPTFVLARTHPRTVPSEPSAETAPGAGVAAKLARRGVASSALASRRRDASLQAPARQRAPLVHVDAYRLSSAVELDDLDIDFAASIVVVEWGEGMLAGVAESWLTVDIDRPHGGEPILGDDAGADDEPRSVRVTGTGGRWLDLSWLSAQGWLDAPGD